MRKPPVVCIEVLSPGDTITGMQRRINDYLRFGVENIWLIDPIGRLAWTADANGIHLLAHNDSFIIPNTPVQIPLADLYARLDKQEQALR